MPRGVTDQFLRILHAERKGNFRALATVALLAPLAYFMAELTDEPLAGIVVLLAAASLAVGTGSGLLWARHRTKRYSESLRDSWNSWMRMSLSCTRVDEVADHVAPKRRLPSSSGLLVATLVILNAALFAALWTEVAWAFDLGLFVTSLNGLALGALAGQALWTLRWVSQFSKALDELIRDGQVGLWGEV